MKEQTEVTEDQTGTKMMVGVMIVILVIIVCIATDIFCNVVSM